MVLLSFDLSSACRFGAVLTTGAALACSPQSDPNGGGTGDNGQSLADVYFGKPDVNQTDKGSQNKGLDIATDATPADGQGVGLGPPDADATGATPSCTGTPAPANCSCSENADCETSFCIDTPDGKLCAGKCVESCPTGFACASISSNGGDVLALCVPKWGALCNPCAQNNDCNSLGIQGAVCVDRGADGKFCGAGCKTDADCPESFACQDGKTADGKTLKQCTPVDAKGAIGQCFCSKFASAQQLSTVCSVDVKDASGYKIGQCKGARVCNDSGLSACSAPAGVSETCNGEDDNCDGKVDEGTCDDGNACTVDSCDGKVSLCVHTNAPGACDADSNACTEGDVCADGKCLAGKAKICDDANPCTIDACLPASGCTATNDDGAPCTDGNTCTQGDLCKNASCIGGPLKACPNPNQCTSAICEAKTGICALSNVGDGKPCDDGSLCTQNDACKGGNCGGAAVDCDDKNVCTLDSCDGAKGCVHTPGGQVCDDSDACTDADACKGGACVGVAKAAKFCDDNEVCTTDACDAKLGCVHNSNAIACDDGNACTQADVCKDKKCAAGSNICGCNADSECLVKEDGNLCNGTLFCDKAKVPYQCNVNPTTVIVCSAVGDTACALNSCNILTGKCAPKSLPDSKACDADGSVCTVGDTCLAGVCKVGTPLQCNDASVCTDDSCDAKAGCLHTANSAPCDADGNLCTVNDACAGKVCLPGAAKKCDDGIACTLDSCEPATGNCKHDGSSLQGQACDADNNLCTQKDVCKCGVTCATAGCVAGPVANCDDANACTIDSCSPAAGCSHAAVADKTVCGTNLWCFNSACVAKAYCGDGAVNQVTEQCDDANNVDGDGCSSTCQKEGPKSPTNPGDLMITEIMPDPAAVIDDVGEWFEIYNPGGSDLLVTGLTIKDNVGSEYVAKPNLVIKAKSYFWFGTSANIEGVSPDYVYSYGVSKINLSNTADEVAIWFNATQIDIVKYGGTSWKGPKSGASYQLSNVANVMNATGNDSGLNWCFATTPLLGGADLGTPGLANKPCP